MDVDGGVARVGTGAGGARGPGGGRWLVGDLAVSRRRDGMEMRNPLVNGLMSDWEQVGVIHMREGRVSYCFSRHTSLFFFSFSCARRNSTTFDGDEKNIRKHKKRMTERH